MLRTVRTVQTQIPLPNLGRKKQGLRAGVHGYERGRGFQGGPRPFATEKVAAFVAFLRESWPRNLMKLEPRRPDAGETKEKDHARR
jgi:hypothetical protein